MQLPFPSKEFAEHMSQHGYALSPVLEPMLRGHVFNRQLGHYGEVPVEVKIFDHYSCYIAYILVCDRRVGRLRVCRLAHGWHVSLLHDWARWALGKASEPDKVEPVEIYWGQL